MKAKRREQCDGCDGGGWRDDVSLAPVGRNGTPLATPPSALLSYGSRGTPRADCSEVSSVYDADVHPILASRRGKRDPYARLRRRTKQHQRRCPDSLSKPR